MLFNLITNAVDAAERNGHGHGRVAIATRQRGDRLLIVVEVDGVGVAPIVPDRLFEPFETTKRDGMGLGLTLVRQIVEAHAGVLRWENVPSAGARFTVELRIDGPRRYEH